MADDTKGEHRVLLHSGVELDGFTPPNPADHVYLLRGATEHFTVSFAASLGSNGPVLADAVLASCEADYNQLQSWFGSISIAGLPFAVFLQPGTSGASHIGCHGTLLSCDTLSGNDNDLERSLVVAEAAEVFMANQGAGWNCGGSNGEALSRVLAAEIYPNELNPPSAPGKTFATAAFWLNSTRPDFINSTASTDLNKVATGCGTLFINWLRFQLGFSLSQIVQAGGGTLAATCQTLTGWTDGWAQFSALIGLLFPPSAGSVAMTNDNAFPASNIEGMLLQNMKSGPVFVIVGGAKFQIPDSATQSLLFPNSPVIQINGASLSEIGVIPVDGTFLREESSSNIWMIVSGMKQIVPPVLAGAVRVLWDGALAQIPTWPSSIAGTVTDEVGNPLVDATVLVRSDSEILPGTGNTLQLSTDSHGRYRTPAIPPRTYNVSATQSGFVPSHATISVDGGVAITGQDFFLQHARPFTVQGMVTDWSGAPLTVATVALDGPGILTARTDSSGHYSLSMNPGSYDGPYTLSASAPDWATSTVTLAIPNGATITHDFKLPRPHIITGQVVDASAPNERVIQGARVSSGSSSDTTRSNGIYVLTMPAPGVYNVTVIARGFESRIALATIPESGAATLNFSLPKASGIIAGNVFDDDGGISHAAVTAHTIWGPISANSDHDGNYTLTGLPAGETQVSVTARHHQPEHQSVQVVVGHTVQLEFRLEKVQGQHPH